MDDKLYVVLFRAKDGSVQKTVSNRPTGSDYNTCIDRAHRRCKRCSQATDGECRFSGAELLIVKPYARIKPENININGAVELAMAVIKRSIDDVIIGRITIDKCVEDLENNPFISEVVNIESIRKGIMEAIACRQPKHRNKKH